LLGNRDWMEIRFLKYPHTHPEGGGCYMIEIGLWSWPEVHVSFYLSHLRCPS
jgi:hypothetical protein